jgi:replication factor C subunit 3/5
MSDFEDEMDVDAPAVQGDIKFSSDNVNSKGKRSAANLPVEAEDSLPWYIHSIGEYLTQIAYRLQGREISTKFT